MTKHTVVIGDSRNMKEVEDETVHLVVTSPPYWKLKDYGGEDEIGQSSLSYEDYMSSLCSVFRECARTLVPDGKICINIMPIFVTGKETKFGRRVTKLVITDLEEFMDSLGNMYFHSLFIWDKRKAVRFSSWGSYPYPPNLLSSYPYEWIIVFSKEGKREPVSQDVKEKSKISHQQFTDWVQNSIWDFAPASAEGENHPAPFPEELPNRCITLFSFAGDTVLDPFLGSGTTMKVAKTLGRNSIGYEINEKYLPIIKKKIAYGEQRPNEEFTYEVVRQSSQ
jgi:site-specific DNA-methyltransferase (adenine-specific)